MTSTDHRKFWVVCFAYNFHPFSEGPKTCSTRCLRRMQWLLCVLCVLFGNDPAKNGPHHTSICVRVNLMIWDCITYEGVGTLTVVDGNTNAHKYIEVIDNVF